MNFGKTLQELRKNNKMMQKELAIKLGCSPKTISGYERNEREPNITTLNKISDIFGVSLDYLFDQDKSLSSLEESFPAGIRILRRADKQMSESKKRILVRLIKIMLDEDN